MSSKEMRYEYKRIGSTITKCFLHRSINVNTTMGKSSIWSRGPPRRNIYKAESSAGLLETGRADPQAVVNCWLKKLNRKKDLRGRYKWRK